MKASECSWCRRREELGWYGDAKIHHCRTCHRTWTGTSQAHCVKCHHHFSSNSACDRHLTNELCTPPQECRSRDGVPLLGLRKDKYGYTWSFAGDGSPWWLARHPILDITDEGPADPEGGITPDPSPAGLSSAMSEAEPLL
jgi:hypothetical protein